jgi:hypothetical protein
MWVGQLPCHRLQENARAGPRGEKTPGRTDFPLTNYRGIELRDFSAEIARLALIISEYQCDVTYRGPKEALSEFLLLDAQNWITCGNALQLDWLSVCPPTGTWVKFQADDLGKCGLRTILRIECNCEAFTFLASADVDPKRSAMWP